MSRLWQKFSQSHPVLSIIRWFDDYAAIEELENHKSDDYSLTAWFFYDLTTLSKERLNSNLLT